MLNRATPAVLLSLVALAGCASSSSKPAPTDAAPKTATKASMGMVTPVNKVCPVMGDDLDPSVTVNYKGQVVGFCCSECVEKWRSMTDDQKDAKLKKSM